MRVPIRVAAGLLLVFMLSIAGCSWNDAKAWKRSVCNDVEDPDERAACEVEARKSEGEYRLEKDAATDGASRD